MLTDPQQPGRRRLIAALALLGLPPVGAAAPGQKEALTIVVPFPPGGANDVIAREVGTRLARTLQLPLAVQNRSGGNTIIGSDEVARAEPNGRTLLMTSMAHATARAFFPRLPYDPAASFEAIGLIATGPFVVVAREGLPVKSWEDFRTYSQDHPGLTYSSTGNGGSSHLITELLRRHIGAQWTHVPYRGAAPAVADVVGGQVDFTLAAFGTVAPFLKAQRLRPLAVTGAKRLPAMSEVRPLAECGVTGFDAGPWWGLVSPARTPEPTLVALRAALAQALRDPGLIETLQARGLRVVAGDALAYQQHLARESERWSQLVKDARIDVQ